MSAVANYNTYIDVEAGTVRVLRVGSLWCFFHAKHLPEGSVFLTLLNDLQLCAGSFMALEKLSMCLCCLQVWLLIR